MSAVKRAGTQGMGRPMMARTERAQRCVLFTVLFFLCLIASVAADIEASQTVEQDTDRKPLFTTIPDYPATARRDRIEGEVQVCFDVTRNGRTRRIAVRKSTHRVFEKPAIRAVRASTYEPLPRDASMSGIKACRTFRFTLEPVVEETTN